MGEGYDVKLGELEWDFVPEYGEGKITARLRQLTVEEYDSCLNPVRGVDRPRMTRLALLNLDGISVNGDAVIDAQGLLAAPKPLMSLFMEIWIEIQKGSEVTEEESKN